MEGGSKSVSYPYGSGRKCEDLLSLENYWGRVVFIPKYLGDLFLTIITMPWC